MSIHKPIDPTEFVEEMTNHWHKNLKNVPNQALKEAWRQMVFTFNAHITADPEVATKWSIVQSPTGSGKSQGTALACGLLSNLSDYEHPGVLIVQKLMADCDLMADHINQYGVRPTAIAYHSDVKDKISLNELQGYPVLVITHRAYELALDHLGQEGRIEQTWPFFHQWEIEGRQLIVVDECIDVVEHSQAGLDGLRMTLGAIPQKIRRKFPTEIEAIEAVVCLLDRLDRKFLDKKAKMEMVNKQKFLEEAVSNEVMPDFKALRYALRTEGKFDMMNLRTHDAKAKDRIARTHDERLKALHNIFRSWAYYAPLTKEEGKNTYNTARLLVPDNVRGAVVLDGTAAINPLYKEKVFKRARVIPPVHGCRNYKNVSMYVSHGHWCGKRRMSENKKDVCDSLIAELERYIGEGRKVFIATHKELEPMLITYDTSFEMRAGHYGAINGSNDWQD